LLPAKKKLMIQLMTIMEMATTMGVATMETEVPALPLSAHGILLHLALKPKAPLKLIFQAPMKKQYPCRITQLQIMQVRL